ncbi:MAG TPA: hypothetical protein VFN65_12030 [Solirubrobacteraceae bacterium]|nr:hypothetical protein [Solirubrobacteraceae bacterium]
MELPRRTRMRIPAAAAAAFLLAAGLAGCGGSGASGTASSSTAPGSRSSGSATTPRAGSASSLTISPARPTTRSELSFTFTAPLTSGVHGRHVISYSLSLVGPQQAGCVSAHEAGAPRIAAGPGARITIGPGEPHASWCAGRYVARVLELASAHCTGATPCPQYVRVVAVVGRRTFTVSRA